MSILKRIQRAFECDQVEGRNSNHLESTAKIIKILIQRNGLKKSLTIINGATHHLNKGTTRTTKVWQAAKGIKLLKGWPGNSPDLNLIENLWIQVKHSQREEHATSTEGIKKIAQNVW